MCRDGARNEYKPAVQHLHLAFVPVNIAVRSADRHFRLVLAFQGTRVAPGCSFARYAKRHRHLEDVFAEKRRRVSVRVQRSRDEEFACAKIQLGASPIDHHFEEKMRIPWNTLDQVTASRFDKTHAIFRQESGWVEAGARGGGRD